MDSPSEVAIAESRTTSWHVLYSAIKGRWQMLLASRMIYLAWLGSIATLLTFGGRYHFVCDWFTHFRWQLILVLTLGIVATWRVAARRSRYMFAAAFLCNVWVIGVDLLATRAVAIPLAQANLNLIYMNVNAWNETPEKARQYIKTENPDLVVVVENSQKVAAKMALHKDYPFLTEELNSESFSYGVYSRFPLDDVRVVRYGWPYIPTGVMKVRHPEKPFWLIVTHPPPPRNEIEFEARNEILMSNASQAATMEKPVVLVGDFNLTPGSPIFGDILQRSGLVDSRAGRGMQFSWPTKFFPFAISIDHVLISPDISLAERRLGPDVGSDHFPVQVKMAL